MNARFQRFHTKDLYMTATIVNLTCLRIFCMIQPSNCTSKCKYSLYFINYNL